MGGPGDSAREALEHTRDLVNEKLGSDGTEGEEVRLTRLQNHALSCLARSLTARAGTSRGPSETRNPASSGNRATPNAAATRPLVLVDESAFGRPSRAPGTMTSPQSDPPQPLERGAVQLTVA